MTRDEVVQRVANRLIAEFGWEDSPGDHSVAFDQALWAVEEVEAAGALVVEDN